MPEYVHDGVIEKEAFLPPPHPRPYETSVIMHGNEGPEWRVGEQIGQSRKRPIPLVGSAEFSGEAIMAASLYMEPQPTTISRNHANLKGWHETDKMTRLMQAETIASLSEFCVAP